MEAGVFTPAEYPPWASAWCYGTWQDHRDRGEYERHTLIQDFHDISPHPRDSFEGLGERHGFTGRIFGGAFGANASDRVERILRFYRTQPAQRRLLGGHSRGAAICMAVLYELGKIQRQYLRRGEEPPDWTRIDAVILLDLVASFGVTAPLKVFIPEPIRRWLNIDYSQFLPRTAERCLAIYALDESRPAFRPTLVLGETVERLWVPGRHSDIGGYGASEARLQVARSVRYWLAQQWPETAELYRWPGSWMEEPTAERVEARPTRRSIVPGDLALVAA